MKILFADSVDDSRLNVLRDAGHECIVEPSLNAESLPDQIGDAEVLVVRSTKVSDKTVAAGSSLSLIVRAGAGTDNVDKAAASAAGVYVCNVPGKNAIAVAELTMGLLLAIDRNLADNVADLRNEVWDKARYTKASGLAGKTLAIIGLGEIGLAVAERAKAFGLSVIAVRKDHRSAQAQARIRSVGVRLVADTAALLKECDIVSIHVPKSPETVGMVDEAFLGQLRDGAIVLNTSRGDMVDEAALLKAMNERGFRAGLDVWPNEPSKSTGEFKSELAKHPSVVGSHHIGASTQQAQEAVADGTVAVINAYAAGAVRNCVNLDTDTAGSIVLNVRHLDEVGVLAKVFAVIRANGLSVKQMQNQVFAGGQAAVATINIDGACSETFLTEVGEIQEVLSTSTTAADAPSNKGGS